MKPRTLLLPLLLATACGTVGRDDDTQRTTCSGLGPWTDLGPVEVCLGSAEAVAGSGTAPADGWCVADEARPCTDDAECRTEELCRCGLCRVVRCSSNAECQAGRTCVAALARCATTCDPAVPDSCPQDFVCHLGGCVAACSFDTDCAHGESCSAAAGRCTAVPCAADADCEPGRRCEIQRVAAEILHPDPVEAPGDPWLAAELRRLGRSEIVRLDHAAPRRLVAADDPPLLAPRDPWEHNRVGAPAVAVHNGTTWLFYAGGDDQGLGLATSDHDGTFVRRTSVPILAPTEPWEAGRIGAPAVWPVGDELRLLYVGGDGNGVGLALQETDGTRWRSIGGPVVVPATLETPDRWVALDAVAEPDVAGTSEDGSTVWLVAARGRVLGGGLAEETAPLDWSLGALLVEPLLPLPPTPTTQPWPWGPVLAGRTGVGPEAVREERAPGARQTADGWELWYVEPGNATRGPRLRTATCP